MRDFGHERDHRIKIFSEGSIPNYSILKNFDWVDQYRRKLTAEAELQRLRGILAELRRMVQTRAEFIETCRQSFDEYHHRRIQDLSRFLGEAARKKSRSPFSRFEKLHTMVAAELPFFSDIEAAVDLLPDDLFSSVDESTRGDEEKRILAEIERIDLEIASLTPPPFMRLVRDGIVRDVRATFLDFWRDRQEQFCEGFNAAGFPIVTCEVREQERDQSMALYLSRHPYLQDFVRAESCALLEVAVNTYYLVTRFQQVMELHVQP